MKNILQLFLFGLTFIGCKTEKNSITKLLPVTKNTPSIHQFKVEDIQGNTFDFSVLKGKKIMVVNTASKCGLTPQYKELEAIYNKYKNNDFIIIGFPANNFLSQEPGSNEEIITFCQKNYGISFPMMAKIDVKGKNIHPIYQFLTEKAKNGVTDSKVKWNFQKYLLNKNGQLEMIIPPKVLPTDEKISNWIKNKPIQ